MNRIISAVIVFIQTVLLQAQNLVPNPGFEQYSNCPNAGQINYAIGWSSVGATPNYFNVCSSSQFSGVPLNFTGWEYAKSGVAYAGFYTGIGSNFREYIQAQLKDTLEAGKKYYVSFYVSLADSVQYASNSIGAYFSQTVVNGSGSVLPYTPQIANTSANPLTNKNGWTLVADTFTAIGNERYITIGNFINDANSDTVFVGGVTTPVGSSWLVYYYIDDVGVYNCSVFNAMVSSQNIACSGACTGTAAVTPVPTSGTAPYTYLWTGGQTTSIATGLCAGNYTVTVTDAGAATVTATVSITQPAALTASVTTTNAACLSNTGTAKVNPAGGTPGYTYSWNNGQTSQTATGLAAGTYTATVTDANHCTQIQTVTITSVNTLSVSVSSTQTRCAVNNGTAAAAAAGGSPSYTYLWSNKQTTQTATGLAAGTYTAAVTDGNGCMQTQTVSVTQTPGPIASVTAGATAITLGDSTQLTATGGGTYSWSPAIGLNCTTCSTVTATASPLWVAGGLTYCVFVTDTNNCTDSACITINVEIPCGALFLPNAFSPNGDGENDFLRIYYGRMDCIKSLNLIIYDRWGEKVFETTDPGFSWDAVPAGRQGTCYSKTVNTQVLIYHLIVGFTDGNAINRKGNISIIR